MSSPNWDRIRVNGEIFVRVKDICKAFKLSKYTVYKAIERHKKERAFPLFGGKYFFELLNEGED